MSIVHQPTMEDFVTMTSNAVQQVQEDMALIARGEKIDLRGGGFAVVNRAGAAMPCKQ
ncbi:hypothetical protein [Sinorhizobium fredii]|uniref:hypothetical protein n=1 Tax=Rhizobium fredii TaxID=380 RepID=UPI0012FD99CD|nr:hypothetical protein [Sinorhizobium fredii]